MKTKTNLIVLCLSVVFTISCKKQDDFLNAPPSSSLAVIKNLDQLQKLLQNDALMNNSDPGSSILSGDEYYISFNSYQSLTKKEQQMYVWAKDIDPGVGYDLSFADFDWTFQYAQIFNANLVLDNLQTIKYPSSDESKFRAIKGTALFFRAYEFYNLLQIFSRPYDPATANSDLGICLRLTSNINAKVDRSSVAVCYSQIIQDIQTSMTLLPQTSNYQTLPTVTCANALLARIYLAMSDYNNAYKYANISLAANNTLTDYNTIPATSYYFAPISSFPLPESLFMSEAVFGGPIGFTISIVDPSLYNSYENNDLRQALFFQTYDNEIRYKGSYEFKNFSTFFTGLANDEVYLIRAECSARLGNTSDAMKDLNTLLVNRYKTGTYVTRSAASADDALGQILKERKKELAFRGTRWTDLRRLNKDPRFQVTLTRNVNGTIYTLPPNDPRYVLPIPFTEIQLTGIPQNQR
jgi:hypothetical protein